MNKYVVYFLFTVSIVGIIGVYFHSSSVAPKIAYVNLEQLYSEFKMKKELESKLVNVQQARKSILDSMKIQLNALSFKIKSDKDVEQIKKYNFYKQEYLLKERDFDEENSIISRSYTNQIWTQINQYIKDYGKEEGYEYILGAEGSGAVMYASDENDLTKILIEYINSRYDGKRN